MNKFNFITLILLFTQHLVVSQTNTLKKENLVIENIPEIGHVQAQKITQYQNARQAFFVDWNPNGEGMLIKTRFGETDQFHLVKSPGAARNQITFFDEPVNGGSYQPSSQRNAFLFSKDIGGNEAYQIYYFNINDGSHRIMTDGSSRNHSPLWNNKGNKFVFSSTKRNDKDNDIYLCDEFDRTNAHLIFQDEGFWFPIDWASNDAELTIGKYISANQSELHVLNAFTGEISRIKEGDREYSTSFGIWSENNEGIFLTSDYGSDFKQLKFYEFETKTFKTLSEDIKWNIENLSLSPNGKYLAFTANENGIDQLYIYKTVSESYQLVPLKHKGVISNLEWKKDNENLAMTINSSKSSSDVFVFNLINYKMTRWTVSETGGLNTNRFVDPELISYKTFDNRDIPAFFYKPNNEIGPYSVLIYIHGGPESQYRPRFYPMIQYFINELGIAVIAPNVRGSSGYGKEYMLLDNGYKREDSVKDIGALLDWIEKEPSLDASRVGVIGGSYGGYMSLASMTHYNDRLNCGIDVVGISNFVTFLENTKLYRKDLRRVEYGDERDPEMNAFLQKISPTTNVGKITKPLFIAQGLNDPRVPASESEQILEAIRRNGVEAWYLLAKDEGHGFKKKSNRDFYNQAVVMFLDKFLVSSQTSDSKEE